MVWVDFELAGYRRDGVLPDNLNVLRGVMEKLIEIVSEAVKNDMFKISKDMLLALYMVLQPDNADESAKRLPPQLNDSDDFNKIIHELRAMCEDEQCKKVLTGVHGWSARSCRAIAEGYESGVYKRTAAKALLFRQQNQGILPIEKENELENENEAAREQSSKVSDFCAKYKLKA